MAQNLRICILLAILPDISFQVTGISSSSFIVGKCTHNMHARTRQKMELSGSSLPG